MGVGFGGAAGGGRPGNGSMLEGFCSDGDFGIEDIFCP
jgi:hypothetical protein